jgi:hypothetical protein
MNSHGAKKASVGLGERGQRVGVNQRALTAQQLRQWNSISIVSFIACVC